MFSNSNEFTRFSDADRRAAENLKRLVARWQAENAVAGRRPSQRELATTVGATQGAISQFLSGRTRIGAEMTLRLAHALGVHPSEIRDDLPYPGTPAAPGVPLPADAAPGTAFLSLFRGAAPYISAHRGRTFVVALGGEAVSSAGFDELVHDLARIAALGIKLVVVHGIRPQLSQRLSDHGIATTRHGNLRVTPEAALPHLMAAAGQTRLEIEARFATGLANTPGGARVRVASGNFVTARPLGIRGGIDFGHTGTVRRVDEEAIRTLLDEGAVVLLSPVGFSPSGELFNLPAPEVAAKVAVALHAEKLLYLTDGPALTHGDGRPLRELTVPAVNAMKTAHPWGEATAHTVDGALAAISGGVARVHLLDHHLDGALLLELFTRDGVGTLIAADRYEATRAATVDDVGGILELIAPLEESGVLVRRSRERLEAEIGDFVVKERDGMVVACAALHPFPRDGVAELACLAVHPDYAKSGRGGELLAHVERQAKGGGLSRLFALTTQTAHWFVERGFAETDPSALPVERQALYNWRRGARVYEKRL